MWHDNKYTPAAVTVEMTQQPLADSRAFGVGLLWHRYQIVSIIIRIMHGQIMAYIPQPELPLVSVNVSSHLHVVETGFIGITDMKFSIQYLLKNMWKCIHNREYRAARENQAI